MNSLSRPHRAAVGFQESEPHEYHPMTKRPVCDTHGFPAVCFGADLANPKHRCPICCRENPQFGGFHGRENYLSTMEYCEGYEI